ncbi:ROK family protein [Pseudarthrobacter sp. N5]|uniref:ROK family transcriptional regulator n=1 Tax=Pseudarthrobacter sp. N5 TaxID=3418416 RepID=UPI003CF17DFF
METVTRYAEAEYAPGSVGDVFRLIREGVATSRPALARRTGLAPSTVSLRVDALTGMGLVVERGSEDSIGGRRARRLSVSADSGVVATADVGANHARIALSDMTGQLLVVEESPLDTASGPIASVEWLWEHFQTALDSVDKKTGDLRGIAIGLPAPIEHPSSKVILPSFMPSWHNADLPRLFRSHTELPILIENDANLVALAENAVPDNGRPSHLLAVKLGTRIGCGIISAGRLHRGAAGAAGEISHISVPGTATLSCSCPEENCLESVASGGALVARLRNAGYSVAGTADVVELGRAGDPAAVEALREAGAHIGSVLSSIVNFFSPHVVVLGGAMSASAPLVAALRAELFRKCLPLIANDLSVRTSINTADAGVKGATHLILEELLAPARIEHLVRSVESQGNGPAGAGK